VQYLVEAHGGTVTAESAGKGKGATFAFTLPLIDFRRDQHDDEVQPRGDGSRVARERRPG